MISNKKASRLLLFELLVLLLFSLFVWKRPNNEVPSLLTSQTVKKDDYIKWVSFDVSHKAMDSAYRYDVESREKEISLNWIELLAYLGTKYGGDFSKYKESHMSDLVSKLSSGKETMDSLTSGLKNYDYYLEAYTAVLGGMVGEFEIEVADETSPGGRTWETKYGLKAYHPIAKHFPFSHFDDFGVSRSYGYKRKHLGHDMMGQVGTPVIAVESGYVEIMGWNQYGGWRIGIRSFDQKRYYYYAHLRKNFPFNTELKEGSIVQAGDVIGYLGRTGYSNSENANNISTPHLHFGLQLIFDESQKESNNEIWIDCYELVQFLYKNRSETIKNQETKEYSRVWQFIDPVAEHYVNRSIYDYSDDEFGIHIYE